VTPDFCYGTIAYCILWDTLRNSGQLPPKYADKAAALRQALTLMLPSTGASR